MERAEVCLGSLADIALCPRDVGVTLGSKHRLGRCRPWISEYQQRFSLLSSPAGFGVPEWTKEGELDRVPQMVPEVGASRPTSRRHSMSWPLPPSAPSRTGDDRRAARAMIGAAGAGEPVAAPPTP